MPADKHINVDQAKALGLKIIESMEGKCVVEYSFRKRDQAVTFATKSSIKIGNDDIQVDPQLLFALAEMGGGT